MIENPFGMGGRGVGKDDLASAQSAQRIVQARIGTDRPEIDIVNVVHVIDRIDIVMDHQPVQGGAVLVKIALLDPAGLFHLQAEMAGHIFADAAADLGKDMAAGGIERVVQIEDPDIARGEIGGGRAGGAVFVHGDKMARIGTGGKMSILRPVNGRPVW